MFMPLIPRLVAVALLVAAVPVSGQLNSPCTVSMISSFTPCMNFVTNSTTNGTSPNAACCNSLRSLAGNSTDCLCLIVTGSVPFPLPINRTLAISLPRACNTPRVPLQCKASGAPIPAPGPTAFGPVRSPGLSPPPSPQGPTTFGPVRPPGLSPPPSPQASSVPGSNLTPTPAPVSETMPVPTPTSPGGESEAPTATTTNSGSRPALTPSAAMPSLGVSPSLVLFVLGITVLKHW
ncbi:non-specific lipid transfer protein GPI-anchored 20-like [Malania oleifera]|uniref:non-specific lipid transfer protein GPI-anchored 20-like n=1 Tax=Malania oleifera TaxID=397392 RepID=UPI0025AE2C2C|nr:non-specific lipid transfer protein GPI-anchored 20-like [Malania oleifera]